MNKVCVLIAFCLLPSCMIEDPAPNVDEMSSEEQALHAGLDDARHCVVEAVAVTPGKAVTDQSAPATPVCFADFPAAIEFATDGRVQLPQGATVDDVDDELLNGAALDEGAALGAAAANVVAIEYRDANFGGPSLTVTNAATCYTHNLRRSSMPSGWNDEISSARAYAGCNHSYHYEHVNFGGARKDCGTGCSYIGNAMNDKTSSIYWTR